MCSRTMRRKWGEAMQEATEHLSAGEALWSAASSPSADKENQPQGGKGIGARSLAVVAVPGWHLGVLGSTRPQPGRSQLPIWWRSICLLSENCRVSSH